MDYSKIRSTWWSGTCYHKEQLDTLIGLTDVKEYAHILHDKDINPDTKTPKKAHYHFLVHLNINQRGSWFKMFGTDDMGQMFVQPCQSPQGAYDYLIHDTQTARKQGKYLYDPSERTSTIEKFEEIEQEVDENEVLFSELVGILDGKITWFQFLKSKPKRIHMISNIKSAYELIKHERGILEQDAHIEEINKIKEIKSINDLIQYVKYGLIQLNETEQLRFDVAFGSMSDIPPKKD